MRSLVSPVSKNMLLQARPFVGASEQTVQKLKKVSRIAQGMFYIFASIFHFVNDTELQIIPSNLPLRRIALYVTGVCEFLGGLGLLLPRFQRSASWGLAALLVAIWPANIYHALRDHNSRRWQKMRFYHYLRQPMQLLLIAWVLWSAKKVK